MTEFEGVVLRERAVGEQDKFIDILTKERGVIELSAKGSRKINAKTGQLRTVVCLFKVLCRPKGRGDSISTAQSLYIYSTG